MLRPPTNLLFISKMSNKDFDSFLDTLDTLEAFESTLDTLPNEKKSENN